MNLTPSNTAGKIKAKLQEIEVARSNGVSLKDIWQALKDEGYIDCSYNVFGNTVRRLSTNVKGVRETKEKPKATTIGKPEPEIKQATNKTKKPLKTSGGFITKPEINLEDYIYEDE